MTDFTISADLTRGQISNALTDEPEQLVWVLADLVSDLSVVELFDHIENIDEDPATVANFYRTFADVIEQPSTVTVVEHTSPMSIELTPEQLEQAVIEFSKKHLNVKPRSIQLHFDPRDRLAVVQVLTQ